MSGAWQRSLRVVCLPVLSLQVSCKDGTVFMKSRLVVGCGYMWLSVRRVVRRIVPREFDEQLLVTPQSLLTATFFDVLSHLFVCVVLWSTSLSASLSSCRSLSFPQVLDMCAAPGLKTAQLLEALHVSVRDGETPGSTRWADRETAAGRKRMRERQREGEGEGVACTDTASVSL